MAALANKSNPGMHDLHLTQASDHVRAAKEL
jgi:hypothetical protein